MKILKYLIPGLLIAVVLGLFAYQGFVTGELTAGDVFKGVLLIASMILLMVRLSVPSGDKKKLYKAAYPQFTQDVFIQDKKLEKQFFDAVDLFNRNKFHPALDRLLELRKHCLNSSDLYAVTVFTALCCDRLRIYTQAITHYTAAMNLRPGSTIASNLGTCYMALGETENAISAYRRAIDLDDKNATAYNNLSALYFKQGDYEKSLEVAQTAISLDASLSQALATAAICCSLLGRPAMYEDYYRKAVSAGCDGKVIKRAVQNLDPSV